MTHPLTRFLGVAETADARTLLGISEARPAVTRIDAAMRAQTARVHRHPDGNSRDGERVRQQLRDAADRLKAEIIGMNRQDAGAQPAEPAESAARRENVSRKLPAGSAKSAAAKFKTAAMTGAARGAAATSARVNRPTLALTDFDRAALAVMVGCGGWNAESRSRLVSLASLYGVSVQGLMRVIAGLSDYARAGGAHLGVAEIAGPMPAMRSAMRQSSDIDATSEVLSRLLPEFQEDTLWSRLKIIALFSIVTLMAIIVMARLLLAPTNQGRETIAPEVVAVHGDDSNNINRPDSQPAPAQSGGTFGPADFADPPTFLGSGVPVAMADAADECASLPARFDEIARRVSVADESISEAVYRNWEVSLETMAAGWMLADDATRESVERLILDVLFAAAQQPSVSDRLLSWLIPPSGPPAETIDLARGAWKAGMLGRIGSSNLPSVVVIRADDLLHVAIEPTAPEQAKSFSAAARRWLDRATPGLVARTSYDANAPDYWELWISALRKVTTLERSMEPSKRHFDESLLTAARLLAEQPADLEVGSLPTNVIGRLFSMMDINTSEPMRREVLALFENESVTPQDLWIITSMLVRFRDAPWMTRDLVLSPQGDAAFRRRVTDRWQKQWPQPSSAMMAAQPNAGGAALVDQTLLQDWSQLLEQLAVAMDEPTDAQRILRLIAISRLNEAAAAMLTQDVAAAEALLRQLTESLLSETSSQPGGARVAGGAPPQPNVPGGPAVPGAPNVSPPGSVPKVSPSSRPGAPPGGAGQPAQQQRRVGQALGQDGAWAALYAEAMRNSAEKQNLLSALRNNAGTDLGPIDAAVFVGEVYRGTPEEVRELAQTVAAERFSSGPNVAREMLDQFFEAPLSTSLAECISSFTGRVLPALRAPSWKIEARLALVDHRLSLTPDAEGLEPHTIELTETYVRRFQRVSRGSQVVSAPPGSAGDAAEALRDAWNRYASLLISTAPTPADLPALARRHDVRARLAAGPVQQFIAAQVGVLELMAYVTTAEKPPMRESVMILLQDSAARRERALHALDQSIETELATARVWRVRMGGSAASPEQSSEPAEEIAEAAP